MKWKAAVTRTAPPGLLAALNSGKLYDLLCSKVAVGCLHVDPKDIGPATHFMQEPDLTVPSEEHPTLGVNVAFTMVSLNRLRSDEDFSRALAEIQHIYCTIIEEEVPEGMNVDLFCALALDDEIRDRAGNRTRLLETGPVVVTGRLAV